MRTPTNPGSRNVNITLRITPLSSVPIVNIGLMENVVVIIHFACVNFTQVEQKAKLLKVSFHIEMEQNERHL